MKGAITLGIVIVFVIYLILSLYYRSSDSVSGKTPWPPVISKCPEYWTLTPEGKCLNESKINMAPTDVVVDEVDAYDGTNKKSILDEIANANPPYETWDGLTNNVNTV